MGTVDFQGAGKHFTWLSGWCFHWYIYSENSSFMICAPFSIYILFQ